MLASIWFALAVWILEARRQGGPDRAAWLIPLACLWANSHVSYYLGFALVGIHLLDAHLRARAPGARGPRSLWWIALAMAAVSFVNPYGWQGLARPFLFAFSWRNDPLVARISELKPLDWKINLMNGLPLMVAGWPLLLLWRARRHGLDLVELVMCVGFTALGISSNRFVATYAIAAAPYLGRDLDEWVRTRPWPRWSRAVAVRAAVASFACIAYGWYEWTHFEGPIGIAFDLRRTPEYACTFMAQHGVRGRSFNHFYVGGSMLFHFWPDRDRLPFVDIHPEEAPSDLRAAYFGALTSADGWQALDARYHFDYALLSRLYAQGYSLLDLLDDDPTWAPVFVDDISALYVRRQGPMAAVADSFGYRLVKGGRAGLAALVQRAAADSLVRARLILELERQARSTEMNFYGRQMLRVVTAAPPR
jgi:hypothetical protein